MSAPNIVSTLQSASTIAVIGASARVHRPSYQAVKMLTDAGYTVLPVNPKYDSVLDKPCFPDLSIIPETVRIDIVNVFRRPDAVVALFEAVAHRTERTGESITVWTQLGVSSEESRRIAEDLGLPHIENRCIMV